MARPQFRRDNKGLADALKTMFKDDTHELAEQIAEQCRSAHPDLEEVVVDDYVTDRAASSVTIKDVRGLIYQTRDGLLTRAAASVGLEVTERIR